MTCPRCGMLDGSGMSFCTSCGANLRGETETTSPMTLLERLPPGKQVYTPVSVSLGAALVARYEILQLLGQGGMGSV